jgi:hypothetical protein
MKLCETCGNPVPDDVGVCPFCGGAQHAPPSRRIRNRVETVNLEAGLPTVEAGLERLQGELASARLRGVSVLRVIHGWGSSGRGGRLCDACRAFLERERQAGRVKAVLPGDGYSRMTVAARDLLARCPSLRTSERADALNPGITFVELR